MAKKEIERLEKRIELLEMQFKELKSVEPDAINERFKSIEDALYSTKDILMKVPVDATTGHDYQFQNVGETSNKGIELSLFYEVLNNCL